MRLRVAAILLITRLVEGVGSLVSRIQFFLYGILPVLLPPGELSALTRTYYRHSYEGLDGTFCPDAYKWTLENWEEEVTATHMAVKGTVLVLGAGLGRESIALAQLGHRVLGVDNDHDGLRSAANRAFTLNVPVTFVQGDLFQLPIGKGEVDYVLLSGVMYSAIPGRRQRQECVRRFRSILREEGKLILNFLLAEEWPTRTNRLVHQINGWLSRLPGSNRDYQPGDFCSHGHFMHTFRDKAEIYSELTEGGATILELNWREGFAVISSDRPSDC